MVLKSGSVMESAAADAAAPAGNGGSDPEAVEQAAVMQKLLDAETSDKALALVGQKLTNAEAALRDKEKELHETAQAQEEASKAGKERHQHRVEPPLRAAGGGLQRRRRAI